MEERVELGQGAVVFCRDHDHGPPVGGAGTGCLLTTECAMISPNWGGRRPGAGQRRSRSREEGSFAAGRCHTRGPVVRLLCCAGAHFQSRHHRWPPIVRRCWERGKGEGS